jgi:hypothetical protein
LQSATTDGQTTIAQLSVGVAIAQRERLLQQFADAAWKTDGTTRRVLRSSWLRRSRCARHC